MYRQLKSVQEFTSVRDKNEDGGKFLRKEFEQYRDERDFKSCQQKPQEGGKNVLVKFTRAVSMKILIGDT